MGSEPFRRRILMVGIIPIEIKVPLGTTEAHPGVESPAFPSRFSSREVFASRAFALKAKCTWPDCKRKGARKQEGKCWEPERVQTRNMCAEGARAGTGTKQSDRARP